MRVLARPPTCAGPNLDRAEVMLLARILLVALLLRVVALGTFPGNITADEADNLQFAFHVRPACHRASSASTGSPSRCSASG